MDHRLIQELVCFVMAQRMPEFANIVATDVANLASAPRIPISYKQALRQASEQFIASLLKNDLCNPIPSVISVPLAPETDAIKIHTFSFSRRHFARNFTQYENDVRGFYVQKYGVVDISFKLVDNALELHLMFEK
jgi:hypothetical protein